MPLEVATTLGKYSAGAATPYTGAGYNEYPDWSPDGSKIVHYHDGGVYIMDATPHALQTPLALNGTMPAWSPDLADQATVVTVDIMPRSTRNGMRVAGRGVVPVAVMSTDAFDATEINDASVLLGPAGAHIAHKRAHHKDIDADGRLDWLGHFRRRDIGLDVEATELSLTGLTHGNDAFSGADAITVVVRTRRAPAFSSTDSRTSTWADVKQGSVR